MTGTQETPSPKKTEDDDGGLMGGWFFGEGEKEEEEEHITNDNPPSDEPVPTKIKDDKCPIEGDPKGRVFPVKYEGESFPAAVKSYEPDSNTYTVIWSSSGVIQYRTSPDDIEWSKEIITEKEESKVTDAVPESTTTTTNPPPDELWLAARRGSLKSVKRFIEEEGVEVDATGTEQSRTALYHAIFCGYEEVVRYLLSKGATDADGTAYITANEEMRKVLHEYGMTKTGRRKSSAVGLKKSSTSGQAGEETLEGGAQARRKSSVAPKATNNVVGEEDKKSHNEGSEKGKKSDVRAKSSRREKEKTRKTSRAVVKTADATRTATTTTTTSSIIPRRILTLFTCLVPKAFTRRRNKTSGPRGEVAKDLKEAIAAEKDA